MLLQTDSERYPRKIQKLFAPRLPFPWKKPIDHPPEKRRTTPITPISLWRDEIEKYKADHPPQAKEEEPKKSKKQLHDESQRRQLEAWEDTELFEQNEFIKDPYRTVFIARLLYSLTELDISKLFNKFGGIESIRVIRDTNTGLSRGYGFIVFEREQDAKNCIKELAPTGLPLEKQPSEVKPRKILVDMERGRTVRNWRPRRLGGGLGGRHYSLLTALLSRDASAAASGRRTNLSSNPYQQSQSLSYGKFNKRPPSDRLGGPAKRFAPSSGAPAPAYGSIASTSASRTPQSIRDKYAKYLKPGDGASSRDSGSDSRSIRSIRRG